MEIQTEGSESCPLYIKDEDLENQILQHNVSHFIGLYTKKEYNKVNVYKEALYMSNVLSSPKTDVYHFRIDPIQISDDNAEYIKSTAMARLIKELETGKNSGELVDEADVYQRLRAEMP